MTLLKRFLRAERGMGSSFAEVVLSLYFPTLFVARFVHSIPIVIIIVLVGVE